MSDQEAIDAIDSLMRDMRHDAGLMTPLAGVPDGLDPSWAPPVAPNPSANSRKRARSHRPPTVSRETQTAPAIAPPPTTGLGDAREYVMDAYDSVIAPTLIAPTAMLTKLRRHVFRRAVSEVAALQLRDRSATALITPEEVVTATISACQKVGINLNL
jgi:hypothetical protein